MSSKKSKYPIIEMIFGKVSAIKYKITFPNSVIFNTMLSTFLPSILIPIVGIVFPALSMALFFIYISSDDIQY